MRRLVVRNEDWPLKEPFVISRMVQETCDVVTVEIGEDGTVGRGEAERPETYVGETFGPENAAPVAEEIEAWRTEIEAGLDRAALAEGYPAGAARNAVDCALWDLEAKQSGVPLWRQAGLAEALRPVATVFTVSLGEPARMAEAARNVTHLPRLKLKLGRPEGDMERVAAVRSARPEAEIIVDANTGWNPDQVADYLPRLAEMGVRLVEQPLPPGKDEPLAEMTRAVPVAADESCRTRNDLPALEGLYDYVNIKLDKAGGLTEALLLAEAAEARGFGIMVGCNLGTSLAMAPALVVAQKAAFVDLDGPLLLARDREPGLPINNGMISPPDRSLWG